MYSEIFLFTHNFIMKAKKIEIVTILNANKNDKNLDHSYIAGRNLNDTTPLVKKLNIHPSYDPSIKLLGDIFKKWENAHKNLSHYCSLYLYL